jgi:hypothetical protein
MKFNPTIALFAAVISLASAEDDLKSTIRFSNNDRLSGSLDSLSKDHLIWKSPILEKPVPFFLKSVLDLSLTAVEPDNAGQHEATITLTNGDMVNGQLASVTNEAVELDTWFAGRMKFNRLMISEIRISERTQSIYRGPNGLDGWKQSHAKPNWTYQSSSFRASSPGGIARDVKLPDECYIAFNAAWGGMLQFNLVFFSDDITSDRPSTGYNMTFQPRSIFIRNCKTSQMLGNTQNAQALQENEKARIEVRASLKTGKICVFVDGRIIAVWTDPEVTDKGIGRGIHFIAQGVNPLQISQIEVGVWDGEIDEVPEPQAPGGNRQFGFRFNQEEPEPEPKPKPKPGRMELRNGDTLDGEVQSIEGGIVTLKTPFRDVKIPIERMRSVALKPVDLERSKLENGDVRGSFPDGTSMVFRLDGTGEGTLTGYSQNFGTATFKIAAFNRIEFNIYDPDLEDIRKASGW